MAIAQNLASSLSHILTLRKPIHIYLVASYGGHVCPKKNLQGVSSFSKYSVFKSETFIMGVYGMLKKQHHFEHEVFRFEPACVVAQTSWHPVIIHYTITTFVVLGGMSVKIYFLQAAK